jgi:hypothetical protein
LSIPLYVAPTANGRQTQTGEAAQEPSRTRALDSWLASLLNIRHHLESFLQAGTTLKSK